MVIAVVPTLRRFFVVMVVAAEQPAGRALRDVDTNLADLAVRHGSAVPVEQRNAVERYRLPHGAEAGAGTDEVRDHAGRLALPEALHNL